MLSRKILQQSLGILMRSNRSCISSFDGKRGQQSEEQYGLENQTNLRLPPCQMPNMLDIGSRNIFDEDHDIFRSSVRRFMRDELAPNHKHYEAQGKLFYLFKFWFTSNMFVLDTFFIRYITTTFNTSQFQETLFQFISHFHMY